MTDEATWSVLVGRCHRRARAFGNRGPAFVVEAAAERLGEKGGRWRRAPGRLPRVTLRLATSMEEWTSVIRLQVVTTV